MILTIIILICIGLFSSILGALVGIGGGVIIVPALVFFGIKLGMIEGMTPQLAIGTSSMILVVTGLSAMIQYNKSNQVDRYNGSIFLIGLIPGAFVGSYASAMLTMDSFNLYFGIFLIFISILLMVRDKIPPLKIFQNPKYLRPHIDADGVVHQYGFPIWIAVIITFIVGFITGLFGIGGGALMTPLMIIVFRIPPSIAIGTSMMLIFFSSLSSAIGHALQAHVQYFALVFLAVSSYFGARFGAKLASKFSSDTLVKLLRSVLLLIGVYLIFEAIF